MLGCTISQSYSWCQFQWRYGLVEVTPAIFSSGKCGFTTRLIVLVAYANCITEFWGWIAFTCPDGTNLSVLCATYCLTSLGHSVSGIYPGYWVPSTISVLLALTSLSVWVPCLGHVEQGQKYRRFPRGDDTDDRQRLCPGILVCPLVVVPGTTVGSGYAICSLSIPNVCFTDCSRIGWLTFKLCNYGASGSTYFCLL